MFALSLLGHGMTVVAVGWLLQRANLDAPPAESEIAMVFAPAAPAVAAAPSAEQPAPLVAQPEPKDAAPPVETVTPAAEAPAPPAAEQRTALAAQPERKEEAPPTETATKAVEAPAPPTAPSAPKEHPQPRHVAASRPAARDARSATREAPPVATATSVSAAAPLLPARPVAGMESDRPPAYPELARRRGQQGRVVLQVAVSAEGLPVTVSIAESSNYPSLDTAAVSAVRQWRFVPASRGGTPVAATAEVPVRFRLTD